MRVKSLFAASEFAWSLTDQIFVPRRDCGIDGKIHVRVTDICKFKYPFSLFGSSRRKCDSLNQVQSFGRRSYANNKIIAEARCFRETPETHNPSPL